ncbi:protein NO VEIN domain-containing protein [Lactococcus lactis]|uniref:protein NO VEIN domain-containing protein n=1 Tax=Lactococcus lactis TaxID=1358 RepID=UPI0001C051D3|nr:DUF3883 domain-containing protein [Lactococcus lactis]ADA65047.1 Restriction endonuclease [Lactococcus lactis subsp. lactis KF147]
MRTYQTPKEYYRRIHHVRPRFKNKVEEVLIFMATRLSSLGTLDSNKFAESMNKAIREFPDNHDLTLKTIQNWRTEISALFGFVLTENGVSRAGRTAVELADNQDLVKFFKEFLFSFQYPGAHTKDKEILELCQDDIRFQPAYFLINLMKNCPIQREAYITKDEATHLIFNDLRVTAKKETISETWKRVIDSRKSNMNFDSSGDVTRYAGDILDYMELANFINLKGRNFYLNKNEKDSINKFMENATFFSEYSDLKRKNKLTLESIKEIRVKWFSFVNRDLGKIDFATNIDSYISETEQIVIERQKESIIEFQEVLVNERKIKTFEIGTRGEAIIINHEKTKLLASGHDDLVHLINFVPTKLAVGYDIQSFEDDDSELRKYIEVKTTISNRSVSFNSIHITKNEWRTAKSVKDRYYIYRMQVSQQQRKLFILKNLYNMVTNEIVDLIPSNDRFDIRFKDSSGAYEELIV